MDVPSLCEELGAPVPQLDDSGAVGQVSGAGEYSRLHLSTLWQVLKESAFHKWRGLVTRLSIKKLQGMRRRGSLPNAVQPSMARRGSLFSPPPEPEEEEEEEDKSTHDVKSCLLQRLGRDNGFSGNPSLAEAELDEPEED